MGLPVQLPPNDDERATMCICKPRPTASATPSPTLIPSPPPTPSSTLIPTPSSTLIPTPSSTLIPTPPPTHPTLNITVMFNDSTYSGDEADGVIAVTLVATGVSSIPYNVTITPSELIPVSAREVFDYSSDAIVVTFNPGETNKTVLVVVNRYPDYLREGSEFFNLTLSLDPAAMDCGITLGDPSVAIAEIEDTDSKLMIFIWIYDNCLFTVIYVNFSQATYSAEEADGMMIITVEADGFSILPYSVGINPTELLPVVGPGKVTKYYFLVALIQQLKLLQAMLRVMEQILCQTHLLHYSILVILK